MQSSVYRASIFALPAAAARAPGKVANRLVIIEGVAHSLRLKVLGGFEAERSEGTPIELASRKARALMAYLAVESGRSHSREFLAALLWGDSREERARHNLRQSLSKIRKCCGCALLSRGETVSIDTAVCNVDVADFERLAGSDRIGDLQACLALYRGELLEGLTVREAEYEDWLLMARARLGRLAGEAADRLAAGLADADRVDEAVGVLERRLAWDAACEHAHRALMGLLALSGRRAEALRQYSACEQALARTLAMEPSAETTRLYESLKNSPASARPTLPPASPSDGPSMPTVAVLPFGNLSGPEDGYFVDGIVEDITTALSRFDSLLVIARGSAFRYRDSALPEREIADALGAQFLVRGTLQRSGRRVRVKVQLIDAHAGVHLWGHHIERDLEDVFVVQDEITSTIASTLAGRVEAARLAKARRAPPERLAAYDFVLRGKDHHHRFTPEDCRICLDMFECAIERDPDYAVAYAWLACGIGQAILFKLDDPAALVARSEAACERGLELDENEAECHRVLAQVRLAQGNLQGAVSHQERALGLNPNDDRSVCSMGELLAYCGRHEEAERWVRKSMRLNPYHPERYWTHLARPLFHLDRFAEALDAIGRISRLRADDHVYRIASNARIGGAEAARSSLAEMRKSFPDLDPVTLVRCMPYERDADRHSILGALDAGRVR